MTNHQQDDRVVQRLQKLTQWEPASTVGTTTVLRAGRRRRAAQIGGLSGVAAVAVVAVTVLVVVSGQPDAGPADGPETTAAVTMAPVGEARAAMAAAAPDPTGALDESSWVDASYWYVKKRVHGSSSGESHTYIAETWMAQRDVSLRIIDGDTATAYGSGPGGWVLDDYDPATNAAWGVLFALPTEPGALDAELRRAVIAAQARFGSADDMVWSLITDIYPESPASSELRAAFWQVAESLEGTTVTAGVTDSEGRAGMAISRPLVLGGSMSSVKTLIVDPDDFTVLETRNTTIDDDELVVTYLAMGPARSLPVEPTEGDPLWPSLLLPGCVFWETC